MILSKKRQKIKLPSGKEISLPSEYELHRRKFISNESDWTVINPEEKENKTPASE